MNEPIENALIALLVICVLGVVIDSALLLLTFIIEIDLFFNYFGTVSSLMVFPIPVLLLALTWLQGWRSVNIWTATAICLVPGVPVIHVAMCGIGMASCAFP